MTKRKKTSKWQWLLTIIMGLYALICLLPMLLVVIVSFSSDASIKNNGFSFFPEEWSLKAWEYVMGYGSQLLVSYGVTIYVTVVGTIFSLLMMSMLAYALSRSCFELRRYISVMMLITMLFHGGQLSGYIVNTTMYHLKDTLAVLILPGIACMNIIILRTYIQTSITEALIESAKIDGAGELRIYGQIVLPLMKPALAAVGFRVAVNYWNDWNKAYLYITSNSKTPLQLLLVRIEKNVEFLLNESMEGMSAQEYAELAANLPTESGRMATLLVALGPIMVAYPFFQKYFVKGLTVGAVKG